MNFESIRVNTGYTVPSYYSVRSHETRSDYLAAILPGQGYTKDSPLLWYGALSAFQSGCDTLNVEYGFQAARENVESYTLDDTVNEVSDFLLSFTQKYGYRKLIFISKSIGTAIAAGMNARFMSLKPEHIFLTPLKETIEFILNSPRILVLVGESDPFFSGNDINLISDNENVRIETFRDANHTLEVRGDYNLSIKILGKVSDAIYEFCKAVL